MENTNTNNIDNDVNENTDMNTDINNENIDNEGHEEILPPEMETEGEFSEGMNEPASLEQARDREQRPLVDRHLLLAANVVEMFGDEVDRDAPQIVALAARQDGRQHLLRLGGGEQELHVRRRLLERLEQGVERRRTEHVHLVDDVDLVARRHRLVAERPLSAHGMSSTPVRLAASISITSTSRFFGDGHAMFTLAAGFLMGPPPAVRADTVECAGDDSRRGGLSHAAYAGENKGVGETAAGDGIGENPDHDLLADEIGEGLGTVFPRQHTIGPGIRQGGFLVF